MIARRVASAYSARRETVLVFPAMTTRVALYQIEFYSAHWSHPLVNRPPLAEGTLHDHRDSPLYPTSPARIPGLRGRDPTLERRGDTSPGSRGSADLARRSAVRAPPRGRHRHARGGP